MNLIQTLEREAIDALTEMRAIPEFRPGDTLRVGVKVVEGDRSRVQNFEGVCIARSNKGVGSSFTVRKISFGEGVILLCGRFEGFDERIFEARALEAISVGDYVLSGGELGAMVVLDACVRLLPGVMGAASSGEEESFEQGLLEYPHYTRPVNWEGRTIPEVLRSGDHARIAAWRHERASEDTRLRRPDLIERHGGASQAPPSGARRRETKADDQ